MIRMVRPDSLIGTIVGPLIWAAYFTVSYLVSGIGCELGYASPATGPGLIRILVIGGGILATLLIIIAAKQAQTGRRRAEREPVDEDQQRHGFLFTISLALNLLSLVGSVWLLMNAILTPLC